MDDIKPKYNELISRTYIAIFSNEKSLRYGAYSSSNIETSRKIEKLKALMQKVNIKSMRVVFL